MLHPHVHATATDEGRSPTAALEEAVGLAQAIDVEVAEARILPLRKITPKTLIGGGQVAECKAIVESKDIALVMVNASLSPSQQRNLERALDAKVIDRTALILEIFGKRARTAEGQLQVELAALNYQKSRLVRSWTHLERQRGGFGFLGGPGESQIETDRRLIAERIDKIKRQLAQVVRTRNLHRKTRRDTPFPLVALVGYTNAGKSTLFNRLTRARVLEADMLFATLDPTIRGASLPSGQKIMLSDTVGFISELPHELVAAFRATLEEVLEADLLVHVRDISHPDTESQKTDVLAVLKSLLGEAFHPEAMLEAWNKIDCITDISSLPKPENHQLLLSAVSGAGCDALLHRIDAELAARLMLERTYTLPAADGKAIAWLHAHGHMVAQNVQDETLHLTVRLSPANAARFERMFIPLAAAPAAEL